MDTVSLTAALGVVVVVMTSELFFFKHQRNIPYCTKRFESEVDYSPYSSGKFKNECSYKPAI
jgi:hypothetical protein